jgi:hypothetical protein
MNCPTHPQMSGFNSTLNHWSWGAIHFDWDIVGPYKMRYSTKNCAPAYLNTPRFGNLTFNWFVLNAGPYVAKRHEHNVNDYDYTVYWLPWCTQPGYDYGGKALIGGTHVIMKGPFPSSQSAAHELHKSTARFNVKPRRMRRRKLRNLRNLHKRTHKVYQTSLLNQTELFSALVAHEMGHTFGADHASCINDNNRGSVAWCDAHVKTVSLACNMSGAVTEEYCIAPTMMGHTFGSQNVSHWVDGWKHRPYFVLGRITFGWADTLLYPVLVSKIDYDHAAGRYAGCDPNCSFRLQRSDAATLDKTAAVAIMLQTTHSTSNGGERYYVFEHRLNNSYDVLSTTSVLVLHWTDFERVDRPPGVYGNKKWTLVRKTKAEARAYGPTHLTDCTPETRSWPKGWDDAGCALGQSIELDTGHEFAPMKMRVHIHSALESGKLLKVTLSQVVGRGQGLARRKRRAL